ncbi:beta-ketoacyl synthase N-terminal-like domain-containing protein [Psychroflexus aestuariivivens]|uniref:beta-ketoacyl synthase N-terminal-like domain-containing protein n=1 Tax=Psychroflexus aestuariivivens TaxID=1795040 RepID=UPI000FDBF4F2|nr:beta-ketoacyl synthase N-terminal-like domain-containing protein [Psychroflexus aestuariivivens]
MKNTIYINEFASISPYGHIAEDIQSGYFKNSTKFSLKKFGNESNLCAELSTNSEAEIEKIKTENKIFQNLDKSVLMAIFSARKAVKNLNLNSNSTGINIGSSRGATTLFEKYHKAFLEGKTFSPLASPTTTLGNISSWVAQDLGIDGPNISHSITCSTALHAMLNAKAWLQSNMSDVFLVGGTEAPLTAFTIAQMQALKLYSKSTRSSPCESLNLNKTENSLVLGEASATAVLSKSPEKALAKIAGFGYATEQITHNISISTDAKCFQKSMKMALNEADLENVDAIVLHAPGTVKGDLAEVKAIEKNFPKMPLLTTNKWQIGHTFGASGMMNIEMALIMLRTGKFLENPFYKQKSNSKTIESVLVNAVGFGGNAVSILLTKN